MWYYLKAKIKKLDCHCKLRMTDINRAAPIKGEISTPIYVGNSINKVIVGWWGQTHN